MATSLQVWLSLGSLHFQTEGGYVLIFKVPILTLWYNEYEFLVGSYTTVLNPFVCFIKINKEKIIWMK